MSTSERAALETELMKHYAWYNRGTLLWSTAHHVTLFLVPILAATATVLLKTQWVDPNIQVVLTTVATVLASISASQGFAKKWQTNRLSRGRIEQIMVEMTDPRVDIAAVRQQLLEIIRQHEEGVLTAEIGHDALGTSKHKRSERQS